MKTWQPLKENDKVRIVAPGAGSPPSSDKNLNWTDLEKCCELLASWKLTPIYSPSIFAEHSSYYNFANRDEERCADFIDALHSDASVIWPFRGGYGSDRVMNAVFQKNISIPKPKLIIGFSDVTNIHNFIYRQWQWPSLHALSMRQLGLGLINEFDITEIREIIFGEKSKVQLPLKPLNKLAQENKSLQATITGGNLTLVQCAMGTPWEANLQNTILLLEDVGESPYRIARIFQQFLASNYLASTKAIILGDFTPADNMDLVLNEFSEQCPLPILRCEGIGHTRNNRAIPLGTNAVLTLGDYSSLTIAVR